MAAPRRIRKAVIPAAGRGTRFLPATKSIPKEMLPIVDRPVIDFVVAEALAAGCNDILIVTGWGKRAIEERFHRDLLLERALERAGRMSEIAAIHPLPREATLHFVWQEEPDGLGGAVLRARAHVGDEPFALLLGDTIIGGAEASDATARLIAAFGAAEGAAGALGLERVPEEKLSRYGIVRPAGPADAGGCFPIADIVEKPAPGEAPSRWASAGRYVFGPEIFAALAGIGPGLGGEYQLADAIRAMIAGGDRVIGAPLGLPRHDIGAKLDFLKTNVLFGLEREDFGAEFRQWLRALPALQA